MIIYEVIILFKLLKELRYNNVEMNK